MTDLNELSEFENYLTSLLNENKTTSHNVSTNTNMSQTDMKKIEHGQPYKQNNFVTHMSTKEPVQPYEQNNFLTRMAK